MTKPGTPFEDRYVKKPSGCWEWLGQTSHFGYGRYQRRPAHRISYERFVGPIPDGMFICHKCDNPPCVNPEHLFVGTPADNVADMMRKGRVNRWRGRRAGSANPRAKLTQEKADYIRTLDGVMTQAAIARQFGVAPCTISHVMSRKIWNGEIPHDQR